MRLTLLQQQIIVAMTLVQFHLHSFENYFSIPENWITKFVCNIRRCLRTLKMSNKIMIQDHVSETVETVVAVGHCRPLEVIKAFLMLKNNLIFTNKSCWCHRSWFQAHSDKTLWELETFLWRISSSWSSFLLSSMFSTLWEFCVPKLPQSDKKNFYLKYWYLNMDPSFNILISYFCLEFFDTVKAICCN